MDPMVNEWIDAHIQDLLDDIKRLCSVPSVKGEAKEGMPYGEGPYRSLNLALETAGGYGFATKNYDNYVGAADFDPALPRYLDILAHTDVVPAGEGWTVTEPFKVIEKDGRLYGRGTSDDKGPLLCALYAMRALKETGQTLSKGVRLIMGADEECGSSDIRYYYGIEPEAEMTFSPDGDFPLINIEKGMFHGTICKTYEEDKSLPRLLSLDAGLAINAVPQKAVLRFEGLDLTSGDVKKAMEKIQETCQVLCQVSGEDEITVIGASAHASTPETGRNAGLAAVMLALELPLSPSAALSYLGKIPVLFPYGVTDGSGIGIRMSDEESHDLTCTLDLFHMDPVSMKFTFDSRTPVMANEENCLQRAKTRIQETGLDCADFSMIPPHVVSSDSPFVKTLLESYETVTGLKGECIAIGGGTYVHNIQNGVAFGAIMPGIDTRMHGADEFFDIDNIILATRIYADAILRLCR
ncbi:MAG: Sapep family Mn(2+)-dependent dipeptidase [Eubacterium sp.]|nr:Sapep family Mn(2+)-dependent dipeptidase [Eubacterium sp.]